MILETLRILADALGPSGSVPLGTHLAAIPIDAGDTVPTTPIVVDATRNLDVAVGRLPATLPALALSFDELTDLDPFSVQGIRDGHVAVLFKYGDREVNAEVAMQDALYVFRALERALDRLPLPVVRNEISMFTCVERRYVSLGAALNDQWVSAGMRAVFQVRDLAP